jgi:quercetin dioxygenase-like cupin family protein
MTNNILSHVVSGCVAALLGSGATYLALTGTPDETTPPEPRPAQAQGTGGGEALQTLLLEITMDDVLGRVVTVREFERAPGTGGTPHRHPGSHIFGYVLEGAYEVRVDDGPLQRLVPGETFYEPPGALHAVSRNGSSTEAVRYLVFTVSDPSLPATVPE